MNKGKGDRTMNIDITIRELTPTQASMLATAAALIDSGEMPPELAEGMVGTVPRTSPAPTAPAKAPTTQAGEGTTQAPETRSSSTSAAPTRVSGRAAPTVDPATIATVAAANPAKPPKAEKPATTKKAAATKARRAEDDSDQSEETADDETEWETNAHGVKQPKGHLEKVRAVHGEDNVGGDADEDMEEEQAAPPKKQTAAPKTAPAKPTAPAKVNGHGFPEALLNARKLRDILAYLIDEGVTDPADLKTKCVELRDAGLPYLEKIPDLEQRVERTIEIMDVNGD